MFFSILFFFHWVYVVALIKWSRVLSGIIRGTLIIISIPIVAGNIICVSKHIRLLSLSFKLRDYKTPAHFLRAAALRVSLKNSMKS